jgi:hypothetical protein
MRRESDSKRKIQEFEIYSHDVKMDVIYQLIEKEWQNMV